MVVSMGQPVALSLFVGGVGCGGRNWQGLSGREAGAKRTSLSEISTR